VKVEHVIKSPIYHLLPALLIVTLSACGGSSTESNESNPTDNLPDNKPANVSYTVSASSGSGGNISPPSTTLDSGTTANFTVTPDNGYNISLVTGCNGSLSGNTYTTAIITADCAVSASFTTGNTVINTSAGSGGSLSPQTITANIGDTVSFTITPDSGYNIDSVSGCSGSLSGNTYTTGVISTGCTVSASFALIDYSIDTDAGTGGSISPSSATVNAGTDSSFTITPDSGYTIENVTGCGGALSGTTYTTGAITANCTVSATFTLISNIPVTTSAGLGGSISPTSATLDFGDTTMFSITPGSGYSINSVTGCGGSLSGNTYTTGTITASCTVVAYFNNDTPAEVKSFIQAVADGDAEPVMVNGQAWTFRTPPPPINERTVRTDHPRLHLTLDNLPGIRTKLQDPIYSAYMTKIVSRADNGSMLENAFLYQITGDTNRADAAKQALLNYSGSYGEGVIFGYDNMSNRLGPVLTFDWIMETLNASERDQIFANIKDNFGYDHKTASPQKDDSMISGAYPWYFNDIYNRHPELYLPALAFTITDMGIDDAWADEVIAWAYDENETRVLGPYGPNRGAGFLDALMSMSLDTGGFSEAATEYYTYWMEAVHAVAFWESATGQPMWSRSPWLEQGPLSLLTSREGVGPSARIMSAIEFATGMYDGDSASLAKYVVNYFGASKYHTVYRAIFGDMRVTEKTPVELGLPTAKYLRGDHVFYSKNNWGENATTLYVRSPYLDIARGVGSEGVFAIDIAKRTPLAPRVQISKTHESAGYSSGMWIYDPTTEITSRQSRGTYWSSDRAHEAWASVSQSKYFANGPGPEQVEITNQYRAISMESGQRYNEINVETAQRTFIHIPDLNRDFIVIYDYIDVAPNLKSAWQMRLMETPTVSGNKFFIPGTMNATVVSPQNHTLEWLGGNNNEFVTPSPEREWYTNGKTYSVPGYSVNRPEQISRLGLGNLYIQPAGQKDSSAPPFVTQSEYLVVIEVGGLTPVTVTRLSDREVEFGQWRVSFSPDGSYSVTAL